MKYFDKLNIDGAVENDWAIVLIVTVATVFAIVATIGADNVIEVMSEFIVAIRAN